MTANIKYLFKGLAWGAGALVALYLIVCLLVTLNKDAIIASVSKNLSEKIGGEVKVGSSDLSLFSSFPNIAVVLKDVKVSDSLFTQHGKYFFEGKEVFLRLGISRLIKKQPPVKAIRANHGAINVFTDLSGYSNAYLLKPKEKAKKEGEAGGLYLRKIFLDDVRLKFADSIKGKFHDINARHLSLKLDDKNGYIKARCDMELLVGGLTFNPFKGAFLKEKEVVADFRVAYKKVNGRLEYNKVRLKINGRPFDLSGYFGLSEKDRSFSMLVAAKNAEFDFLRSIFPIKIQRSLGLVKLDGKLNASAQIGGSLNGGEPLVMVHFSSPETAMATPFMDFTGASFTGTFTNEVVKGLPRKDPNSAITLSGFSALWRGMPVNAGSIQIVNLKQPELSCDIHSRFSLERLNEVMQSESLNWRKGTASVLLTYTGPLEYNSTTPALMNGKVNISDGLLTYTPRNIDLDQINASMHFEKSDFFLDTFRASVFNKPVNMRAEARGLLTLLNTQPNAAEVLWDINMPELDLQPYMVLLQKKRAVQRKSGSMVANASAKIDRVLDEGKLDVNLRVGSLRFKNFTASKAAAKLSLLQDRYVIHEARLNHAGGNVQLKGSLIQNATGEHVAEVSSNLKDVDVRQVFEAFENFGQTGITSTNIEGNLDANVKASLRLRESGSVIPASTKGTVKFSLKSGELINYEPVKKIQQFIFKNRDFENIRFAELKNTLEINGPDIHINDMEIRSSVLTMFVNGTYSSAGNTDLQIRLPLSNLRRRSKDFNPENMGLNAKRGTSILLRGRTGDDGNVRFKLDLFNKFGKENKPGRK